MDTAVLAICLSKLKKVASGVKKVEPSSDGTKLIFTLNDGANSKINVSIPNPVTTYQICNKLSVDTDNDLCYDGNKICKWKFTDAQYDILSKFTVGANGELLYNNTPISGLTQAERDTINSIVNNISFTKDPTTGDVKSVEIAGAVIKPTKDSSGNTTSVKIGDVIVSGSETTTTTNSYTDANGNPVTETTTTVKTSTDTTQTKVTNKINPDNGNNVEVTEVIKGGASGVNVGTASGTKQTVETDGTGSVVSDETKDISYANGVEELWATEDDVNDIINGFGWDF